MGVLGVAEVVGSGSRCGDERSCSKMGRAGIHADPGPGLPFVRMKKSQKRV